MVFGYDMLCDLLEMLDRINIRSAVATRRNLVDPIQRTNVRGLMARKVIGSNPDGYLFFSPFIFYFYVSFISSLFSLNIIPFLFFN
jgi:hypothetical protein